ncbi:aryl-sulfate sulfotransferase [Ferrimonas pelagia]
MAFDGPPITDIVDPQGEYPWWLEQTPPTKGTAMTSKRGYFMGFIPTDDGHLTFIQDQIFGFFNLMGRVNQIDLPRGYLVPMK